MFKNQTELKETENLRPEAEHVVPELSNTYQHKVALFLHKHCAAWMFGPSAGPHLHFVFLDQSPKGFYLLHSLISFSFLP